MNRTKVDWLDFRSRAEPREVLDALRGGFGELGEALELRPRAGGWMGYEGSADVCLGGMVVGLTAFGGKAQKGWVMQRLSGRGCQWIRDWDVAQESFSELPDFQLRRCDIALDTIDSEVTHEKVWSAYQRGAFSCGGRPPKISQILPGDPTDGRTIYVGKRDQAKFLRGYEKGYEVARDFPKGELTEIDGVPLGDMYRLELELKVKHAPLPSDLIDRRDQYFSGSYPYLQEVLQVEPEVFSLARERGPQLDLRAALATVRHQYGKTLFTALAAHHGDFLRVWDSIVGDEHNLSLVQAGVLLVDHE